MNTFSFIYIKYVYSDLDHIIHASVFPLCHTHTHTHTYIYIYIYRHAPYVHFKYMACIQFGEHVCFMYIYGNNM